MDNPIQQTGVKNPPKMPAPKWVFLTPKDAAAMLSASGNRPIKMSVKKEYIRKMENGLWRLSPHGITLGIDGLATDGNHRLHALSESKIDGLWFLVTQWPCKASDLRVDSGSIRTMGDFLSLDQHRVAPLTFLASMINVGSANRRDPAEMMPLTNAFLPYIDALIDACPTSAKGRSTGVIKAGIITALAEKMNDKIYDNYRAFVLRNSGCFESFVSLARQIDTMKLDSFELFSKAFIATRNPENVRLYIKDDTLDEARMIIRSQISGQR